MSSVAEAFSQIRAVRQRAAGDRYWEIIAGHFRGKTNEEDAAREIDEVADMCGITLEDVTKHFRDLESRSVLSDQIADLEPKALDALYRKKRGLSDLDDNNLNQVTTFLGRLRSEYQQVTCRLVAEHGRTPAERQSARGTSDRFRDSSRALRVADVLDQIWRYRDQRARLSGRIDYKSEILKDRTQALQDFARIAKRKEWSQSQAREKEQARRADIKELDREIEGMQAERSTIESELGALEQELDSLVQGMP